MSMECNKDEALRAKEIAEKKMNENDFAGARRVALKAQRLFPELENISQLLTVCDVHCSAENRILGTEKDWYSILQIEKIADEATIKKQYRKLALALHPDKNKFSGAEAAFKIIGEAHLILSDRSKRAFYDSKVGIAVKSAQPKPPSYNKPTARKQSAARNNDANGFSSQFGGQNHQATQQNSAAIKQPFWTCCPYCNIKYQFYREVQNKNLRCQKCQKVFVAYEIAAQDGPSLFKTQAAAQGMPGSFMSQAAAQGVPGSNTSHTAAQGMPGSFMNQTAAQGVPGSHKSWAAGPGVPSAFKQSPPPFWKSKDVPTQGIDSTFGLKTGGTVPSNLGSQGNVSSGPAGSVSRKQRRRNNVVGLDPKAKHRERGTAMPKNVKLPNETELRNKNKKRGMKSETESSESSDMSDGSIMEDTVAGVSTSGFVRRSSRQKHQVSYKENVVDDDDFESPPKKPRKEESSHGEGGRPDGDADGNFTKPPEKKETVSAKVSFTIGKNMNNKVAEEPGVVDVSESDDDDDSGGRFFDYPEPEFNDFDKLREERLFAADQFWACYGDGDGMPRFYAQIKLVQSSPFKVRFTWLEPNPDDEGEIKWAVEGLPIACGKFTRGDSQTETNVSIFSHRLVCEKGKQRGSLMVYPRKGETWALFKDWDMGWSSNPDEHKNSEYEIVEVLSNFVEGVGVEVALLERLRGFVSLFQCRSQRRAEIVFVPATEMFRFSHRIPSFKMSGTEKDGVPEGSFELDPASLPANYVTVCHRPVYGADDDHTKVEGNCSNEESCKTKKPNLSVGEQTPEKSTELIGGSKLGRSSRGQNVVEENWHSNAKGSSNESSQFESGVSTGQVDRKVDREVHEASKSSCIDHSSYSGRKVSEYMLHDFKDQPEEKFQTNQIWALYEPEQKLPKVYGLIKRIEHSPFRLHVAALGSISAPEKGQHPVCGTFMVKHGKPRAFEPPTFSHLIEATLTGKNRYSIYPKVGEVWALYTSWKSELTSSDLKNCECILVEIIDVSQGSTKVSVLVPMTPQSNKKLFRSPRKRSGPELIEIQEKELGRFSHQVPAILQGESSWLVDTAAVPKSSVSGK